MKALDGDHECDNTFAAPSFSTRPRRLQHQTHSREWPLRHCVFKHNAARIYCTTFSLLPFIRVLDITNHRTRDFNACNRVHKRKIAGTPISFQTILPFHTFATKFDDKHFFGVMWRAGSDSSSGHLKDIFFWCNLPFFIQQIKMVIPPSCHLCDTYGYDKRLSYSLLYFKLEPNKKTLRKGEVGHQANWVWFCNNHVKHAIKYTPLTFSHAKSLIRADFLTKISRSLMYKETKHYHQKWGAKKCDATNKCVNRWL